jgi:sugar phosphate permease
MRRSQIAVIAALLVAYASFYLCRANVEAALPFLLRDEGYDKTSLGKLSSIATFAYALGKIVLGAAGDRLGGRNLMLLAVSGSVVCSAAFGSAHGFATLVLFAAANRFCQAGGWPGLVHVVSHRFEAARHGRVMGILSTSYELGNVFALNLSGAVVQLGWRALFVVNPLLLALFGGSAVLFLPSAQDTDSEREGGAASTTAPATVSVGSPPTPTRTSTSTSTPTSLAPALAHLFRSGAFWTTVLLSALLTFIRIGFLTWTPTYLAEMSHATGNAQISASIVKSSVFPAAGVIAALSVGALSDRLGPGRRAPIMVVSLAVLVGLVLALAHGDGQHPTVLIAGIGLFLLGPYSLLAGAMALDAGGKDGSATAAGIIDGAGYLGATAAPYVIGRVTDRAGWSAAFDVVAGAALLATLVSGVWAIVVLGRRSLASPTHPNQG